MRERLVSTVAAQRGIPTFRVLGDEAACSDVNRLRRQTLVIGLSDGARINGVRHSNVGRLTNEQLVLATSSTRRNGRTFLKTSAMIWMTRRLCFGWSI